MKIHAVAGDVLQENTPEKVSIERLLSRRADVWRGAGRPPGPALGTGQPALDACLPTGGWPRGRLVELLPDRFGLGEFDMLLPALAGEARRNRPIVFSGPPLVPCPQALARAGMDLSRLVVLQARGNDQLWAAEQCLKSGLCGAVLVWHPPGRVSPRPIRRLQLAAESGPAPVFIWYCPGQAPPPSLAALRLAIHAGPAISVLRDRGGKPGRRFSPGQDNVVVMEQKGKSKRESQ